MPFLVILFELIEHLSKEGRVKKIDGNRLTKVRKKTKSGKGQR